MALIDVALLLDESALSRHRTTRLLHRHTSLVGLVLLAALAALPVAAEVEFTMSYGDGAAVQQLERVEITGKATREPAPQNSSNAIAGGISNGQSSALAPGQQEKGGDAKDRSKVNKDPGKTQMADPVATDNSKPGSCSNPTTTQPVVIATGEKIKQETDFVSLGQYGLSHQRTYRRSYPGSGMFGAYWWSSLSYPKLVTSGCFQSPDWGCEPTKVQIWKPDGSSDVYQHIVGTDGPALYSAAGSSSGGTLTFYENLQWQLTRDRMTYIYSTAGYLKNRVFTESSG